VARKRIFSCSESGRLSVILRVTLVSLNHLPYTTWLLTLLLSCWKIISVVVETFRFLGSQSESRAIKFLALVADHSPVAEQAGAQTHT